MRVRARDEDEGGWYEDEDKGVGERNDGTTRMHSQVSRVQPRQLVYKREHERIFGDHDRVCR